MNMESALNICHTCLSLDRQLYPLTMFPSLIQLNFLLTNQRANVCWECKTMILKFCDFITKAVTAQQMLMDAQHNNNVRSLSTLAISKEQPQFEVTHMDNPLTETDEIKCIKNEDFNSDIENDSYNECSEQMVKTEDNSESFLMSYGNEEVNASTSDFQMDIKIESDEEEESTISLETCKACDTVTDFLEPTYETVENIESDEGKSNDVRIKNRNKLLEKHEDLLKKIVIIELTDEEVQKRREQKRKGNKFIKWRYRCDYCIRGFFKEEMYKEHVKKMHEHTENNIFNTQGEFHSCDICYLRFETKALAKKHRERHYTVYKCWLCKYEACYPPLVLSHFKEKHGDGSSERKEKNKERNRQYQRAWRQRKKDLKKKVSKEEKEKKKRKRHRENQRAYYQRTKSLKKNDKNVEELFQKKLDLLIERKEEKKERNREYQRAWRQRKKDLKKKDSKEEKEEEKNIVRIKGHINVQKV